MEDAMNLAKFKGKLSLLNDIIYFDTNDYLREKTTNPLKLKKFINEAEALLKVMHNEENRYFLQGTLGNLYRIHGNPKRAIHYLTYCKTFAVEQKNTNREIVSLIRLGEAFKYKEERMRALELFNEAVKKCTKYNTSYLDFALQHKGKCLMEIGNMDEAKECLQEALQLRKVNGEQSLIDSTQQALDFLSEEG